MKTFGSVTEGAISLSFWNCLQFPRESEAPAELATLRFGRSLTLPSNEFVERTRKKHVYSGSLALPIPLKCLMLPARSARKCVYFPYWQPQKW